MIKIREKIKYWKATRMKAKSDGDMDLFKKSTGVIHGLSIALSIFDQSYNAQINVDTKLCGHCETTAKDFGFRYCPYCGRYLE